MKTFIMKVHKKKVRKDIHENIYYEGTHMKVSKDIHENIYYEGTQEEGE